MFGTLDGYSVGGIGFSAFCFVSNLRMLWRFLVLFLLSFNLYSICVFLA